MQNPAPLNPAVVDRSRPVARHPVELATHIGLKTYNRTFSRVEAALFLAEVVVHLQGRASRDYAQEIDQVNGAIARELDRLEAFATGEGRRIGNVLKKGPVGPADGGSDIRYTRPARVELTMRTPRMRRYAALLAELERAGRALDAAWYAGVIGTVERFDLENLLFRNFMRACGVFERLARGLARRVRDDTETPGYRDMLVKRTGRGPDAASAPVVAEEGAEAMTAGEAASLQATEALVADLSASPAEAAAGDAPPGPAAAGVGWAEPGTAPGPAARPTTLEDTAAPVEPDGEDRWATGEAGAPIAADAALAEARSEDGAAAAGDHPAEPLAPEAAEPRRRRLREVLGGARTTA